MKGYRTLLVNILALVLPVLEMTEITSAVPDEFLPYYAILLATANVILRLMTTTPVGQKV